MPFTSREQSEAYIAIQLANTLTPEELESLKQNGIPFGLWPRYRNSYDWLPTLTKDRNLTDIDVIFINGESISDWNIDDINESERFIAVPLQVSFITLINNKTKIFTVNFDEP